MAKGSGIMTTRKVRQYAKRGAEVISAVVALINRTAIIDAVRNYDAKIAAIA